MLLNQEKNVCSQLHFLRWTTAHFAAVQNSNTIQLQPDKISISILTLRTVNMDINEQTHYTCDFRPKTCNNLGFKFQLEAETLETVEQIVPKTIKANTK